MGRLVNSMVVTPSPMELSATKRLVSRQGATLECAPVLGV